MMPVKNAGYDIFVVFCLFLSIELFLPPGSSALMNADSDQKVSHTASQQTDQLKRLKKKHQIFNHPNPKELEKIRNWQKALTTQIRQQRSGDTLIASSQAVITANETITDRVLVILVEFGGTDTMTWDPETSSWDPYGKLDTTEDTGENYGTPAACANMITQKTEFSYSGPLHNQVPVPDSAEKDWCGTTWTPNFSPEYYNELIFGNGVNISYTREDGSTVYEDMTGQSVAEFYRIMSGNRYYIEGNIVGWVSVNYSMYWYGADECPGALSMRNSTFADGAYSDGPHDLVVDAIEAVKTAYPDFNWAQYDLDGDGVIDRLWIIHAGLGEENGRIGGILEKTDYCEGAIWSHSSSISNYEIVPGISAGPYIIMPENCGVAVLAHEMGHNLGAIDPLIRIRGTSALFKAF